MATKTGVLTAEVRELLADNPDGYEISKLPTTYYQKFGHFGNPEKHGFKSWGDLISSAEMQPYCEIFNESKWVKSRNPTATGITVLHPVSRPETNGDGTLKTAATMKSSPRSHTDSNSVKSKPQLIHRARSEAGSEASSTVSSRGKRSGTESRLDGSKRSKDVDSMSSSGTDFSEASHVSMSAYNKQKLRQERNKIFWIPKDTGSGYLSFSTLILERVVQSAEQVLYIDTTFCDRPILENLMEVKNFIRRVGAEKFTAIRANHNKFEFEKGAIFQHGAAIKMANIDALMGMALSNPKGPDGSDLIRGNELLYFVDVNGGPGGAAEYFLWKKKWQAKGFGITPKGTDDYRLVQAEHFPRESFETFYGESATEGSGEIMKPYFVSKFVNFVKESTDFNLAHIMIGSGGEKHDTSDEDQKEIRCKYIFLAELLIALQVVREGGHFVCRVYDLYTPFTVELIYLMYKTFEQVAIFKPDSSLPASSEKYVLCKWRKPISQVSEIANYLSECHKIDWLTKRPRRGCTEGFAEIMHLLSVDRVKASPRFYDYIRRTNKELGNRQYLETVRLVNSIREGKSDHYVGERLLEIQEKGLNLWGIPERVRERAKYSHATTPAIRAVKLLTPYSYDFIAQTDSEGESEMSMATLLSEVKNPKEWTFMPVGRERGFFMCLGGNQIYKYDDGEWNPVAEPLELMNNTLVYADLVDEFEIHGARQTIWTGFHIIDALILGGKDVRELPSDERFDLIAKFARSMGKASRNDLTAIRPKRMYDLKNIRSFFRSIKELPMRSRDGKVSLGYLGPADSVGVNDIRFLIEGVLFVKKYKANFVPADFRFCVQNRLYWKWNDKVSLNIPDNFVPGPIEPIDEQEDQDEDNIVPVHATTLLQHLFTHY